jgi:hypothetical protein
MQMIKLYIIIKLPWFTSGLNYCIKWQLTVDAKKSKTMTIQNNPSKMNKSCIKWKGKLHENEYDYTYIPLWLLC